MGSQATPRAFGEIRLDREAILRDGLRNAGREDRQLILWARSDEADGMAAARKGLR